MLGQRRRRWANIKPTSGQFLIVDGILWWEIEMATLLT